jgi:hypothetical protein
MLPHSSFDKKCLFVFLGCVWSNGQLGTFQQVLGSHSVRLLYARVSTTLQVGNDKNDQLASSDELSGALASLVSAQRLADDRQKEAR